MIQQLFYLKNVGLFAFFKASGFLEFLFVIGAVFSFIYILRSSIKRHQEAKLIKEEVLPELISNFGKVISIEAYNYYRSIRFERHDTIFDVKVTSTSRGGMTIIGTENIVQFNLPNLREKFYIQSKSLFAPKTLKECQSVQVTMPGDFIFYSLSPQFLLNLMQKDTIRDEIDKYQKKFTFYFEIAAENGVFTLTWVRRLYHNGEFTLENCTYGETLQTEAQKLEQICQTAVVFYDELAKKQMETAKFGKPL